MKVDVQESARETVAQIASLRSVHAASTWFRSHEVDLLRMQTELSKIPAPPFGEQARSSWLKEQFSTLGLEAVRGDAAGNVFATYPRSVGEKPKKEEYVALSAHIDTVFPQGTKLEPVEKDGKIYAPGISDNGTGVTALLAVARALKQAKIPIATNVLFIGSVGEEGEGDLRGMRYIFADPYWRDSIAAILVLDGTGADCLVTQALGSKRFDVVIRGPGGHSWSDYGNPNPIVLLARAITQFSKVPVPAEPKTTVNVGVIKGGTSVNSIPESAEIRVDIRSTSSKEIDKLQEALADAVRAAVESNSKAKIRNSGISYEVKLIGDRPSAVLARKSRLLQTINAVDEHLKICSHERVASTDANIPMSLGVDAVSIGAGGDGGGAHTAHEWFNPAGRDLALKRILLTLLSLTGTE